MARVPTFEVLTLTPLADMGALRAFASVRVAGKFTISELRLIQQDGQAPWVSGPQKSWVDANGQKRFSTLVEFHEKEWREALTTILVDALRDHPGGIKQVSRPSGSAFGQEVRDRAGLGGPRR